MFRILFKYYFYCRYCVVLCCVVLVFCFVRTGVFCSRQHGTFMAVLLEGVCEACVLDED